MGSHNSSGVEVELKLGLRDPTRLDTLLAVLPPPRSVREQRNVYLKDPEGRLSAARVMVRVREAWDITADPPELERVVLTIKRRTSVEAGVFTAEEHEQRLPVQAWRRFERGEGSLLSLEGAALEWLRRNHPVRALAVLGEMRNRRAEIVVEGLVLEVDRTSFPGDRVEAEVEVETDEVERARSLVYGAAEEAGVSLFEQRSGKFERFLRYAASEGELS